MIAVLQSLWKELLGSWWVLIVLPVLVLLRLLLTVRWSFLANLRTGFFGLPLWNPILSPPPEVAAAGANRSANGAANGAADARLALVDPSEYRRRWFLELVESALVALFLVFFLIRPFIVQAFYIPSPSMVETLEVNDRILVNKFIYRVHPPHRRDIVVFEPPARATDRVGDDWIKRVIGVPGDRISVHNNHLFLNGVQQDEPYVALLDHRTDKDATDHVSTGQYDYTFPDPQSVNLNPGQQAYVYPAPDPSLQAVIQEQRYDVRPTTDTTPAAGGDYLFFVKDDPKEGLEVVVPPGKVFVMGDNRNDSEDSHYWGYLNENRVLGQAFCIFWPPSRVRLITSPSAH